MTHFMLFLLIYCSFIFVAGVTIFLFLSEAGAILRARMAGQQIILIEGVSSAVEGDVWKSYIIERPITGRKMAWRYPLTKIGKVTLNDDGTGEYCGAIVWKKI